MWWLVYRLFRRAANEDIEQAFYTDRELRNQNQQYIKYWTERLPEDDGQLQYDEVTDEQRRRARGARKHILKQLVELTKRQKPPCGPVERDFVRLFLLDLPWLIFPNLPQEIIRFFGIGEYDYYERQHIAGVDPNEDDLVDFPEFPNFDFSDPCAGDFGTGYDDR